MFDFFKKNKVEQFESAKEKVSEPVAEELVEVDNIAIHVMPGSFRNHAVKQNSAKNIGLVIISGGAVVLLVASAALYYFLFRKPNIVITQEPTTQTNQIKPEVEPTVEAQDILTATGTEITSLPLGDEIATTTVATTTPEIAPEETGPILSVGADSDNDGLTDIEEILLGTSPTTADTDGDGYLDGAELLNLYNPAGEGKLTANSNISPYENKTFFYELLYPATWQTSMNGGDDSVMFKTGDNQFVQVIVQPNTNMQTLDEWYMEQLGVAAINEADRVNGFNWQGIKSPDGLNIYIISKNKNYIFNLTYNPGDGNILEYFNIAKMMIRSFNLKE
ncbi:MAG: hypothetical protein WCL13_00085 [bacterium]